MVSLRRWFGGAQPARRRSGIRPVVESLESRVVLYSAAGNAWPNQQIITISFMPDGTNLGGGVNSNLFSAFNNNSNLAGKWENVILQAAQTWAQQTNINFAVVPDNGAPEGSGPDEQGGSGFGDIRIGGYNFDCSTLALTYQPPSANNYSIAGDMTFNTGQSFNIGSTYDLFTVAMHEFGHALGLNESSVGNAVMYGTYVGAKTGLATDDIQGIRSIYSANQPRSGDAYNTNGASNGTLSTAAPISSLITSSLTALVPDLDIANAGEKEYFSFTAPSGSGSTLELDVQSSGLSLLAPEVTVYSSNGSTVLASAVGAGQQGSTLTVSVSNVVAGNTYYVMIQGANTTQMGTGDYALGLNFKGAAPPTEASPIIAEPDGSPEHCGDGEADGANGNGPYVAANPVITGITPDNGVSSQDGVTNNPRIDILGTAPALDTVTIYLDGQAIGRTIALPDSTWTFNNTANPLADGDYSLTAVATDPTGYSTAMSYPYEVVIDTHTPAPPEMNDVSPDTGLSNTDGITDDNHPTFSGTTEPFAVVNLYLNGGNQPFGSTEADASGDWSYTVGQSGQVTYPGATLSPLVASVVALVDELPIVGGLLGGLEGSVQSGGGSGQMMPDGTYQVTATAMDVAGTVSAPSAPMTVVIDTQPPPTPQVTGISPNTGKNNDGITTAHNLTISGTAQAGDLVAVLLNDVLIGTTMSGSNGAWSFDDSATYLPDGNYAIAAVAMNVAGDISNVSGAYNATIETVAPPSVAGVSVTTGTRGLHQGQQGLSIAGTAPANDQVQVYLAGNLLGTVNANGQGAWSYVYAPTATTVSAGIYNFSAVSIDHSGNASAASPTFALEVGGGPTAGTPQYASGVLSGQATPGSQVTIVDGDLILGVVVASSSGVWQFTPTLTRGRNTVMAEATDGSGVTSLLSAALIVND